MKGSERYFQITKNLHKTQSSLNNETLSN